MKDEIIFPYLNGHTPRKNRRKHQTTIYLDHAQVVALYEYKQKNKTFIVSQFIRRAIDKELKKLK